MLAPSIVQLHLVIYIIVCVYLIFCLLDNFCCFTSLDVDHHYPMIIMCVGRYIQVPPAKEIGVNFNI